MDPRIIDEARDATLWTTWRVQLTIPSVLAEGEEFCLRMSALGPDCLPSDEFGRGIVFEESPGIEGLPKSVRPLNETQRFMRNSRVSRKPTELGLTRQNRLSSCLLCHGTN